MVELRAHDERWAGLYAVEAARIAEVAEGRIIELQHYGSTSIPGMCAKPILDMLAECRARCGARIGRAARAHRLRARDVGGRARSSRVRARRSAHALAACGRARRRAWIDALRFRDALRADRALAAEYEAVKLRLAAQFPTDRARYTDGKAVQRVLRAR